MKIKTPEHSTRRKTGVGVAASSRKALIVGVLLALFSTLIAGCAERNTVKIDEFEDLGMDGVKISIGNPEHVPAGRYAVEILSNLNKINPELANKVKENIVSKDINVRAVLDKVVSKEVDAGFVYRTDAYTEKDKVRIIEIPEEINVIPEYPIAVLKNSDDSDAASEFVKFVLSREGQEILASYGFVSPIENPEPYTPNEIDDTIVVYAAASLTDAFEEIANEFESITGCKVKTLFASSGSLRQKIEGGAVGGESGADVYASASLKHMKILKKEGFVTDYSIFAKNKMVVITPK